jgi:hypothetical protein
VSYDHVEANIRRYAFKTLQDAAALWTPTVKVKDSDVRNPFNPATEDEAVIFRFVTVRNPPERQNVYAGVVGFEVHCMTKRGDLRQDGRYDRHMVLAGNVRKAFRTDIQVYDAVDGNGSLFLGVLQGIRTTTNLRDKRNTIYGSEVDYSVETPNVLQAVVVVTALFQTNM